MMPSRRLVPPVVGAVLAVLSLTGAAAAQNGRVGGVVREEGGRPLRSATVTAHNSNIGQSFTATTDGKGRFVMIGLRSGEWRFVAQAPGFSPQGGMLSIRSGGPNAPITFELKHSGMAFFGALAGVTSKDLQADLAAADGLYAQGKWDDAIAAYRAILKKVPIITAIHLQIASAYRHKKDYDAALTAYNDVLKASPADDSARIGIAMTALERGDSRTAEETLLSAAEAPGAAREVFYSLGEVKLAANDEAAAAVWFEKASAADPFWAKPLLRLGEVAMKKGDNASASRLLARAVDVDPTAPEAATAKSALESLNK